LNPEDCSMSLEIGGGVGICEIFNVAELDFGSSNHISTEREVL